MAGKLDLVDEMVKQIMERYDSATPEGKRKITESTVSTYFGSMSFTSLASLRRGFMMHKMLSSEDSTLEIPKE